MYDVVIIGAGPAGLTAAVYGCRMGKSVLLVEKEVFGGQIVNTPKVENIPGFSSISGEEFGCPIPSFSAICWSQEDGSELEITLIQKWPVRRERPYAKKLPPQMPLITGMEQTGRKTGIHPDVLRLSSG